MSFRQDKFDAILSPTPTGVKNYEICIIGGGVSAGYCALELVSLGLKPKQLAIFSDENVAPYERPALSKAYLHPPGARQARLPGFYTAVGTGKERMEADWYEKNGVELFLGATVRSLNVLGKRFRVKFSDGRHDAEFSYDKLVIATGVRAVTPVEARLKGGNLGNIFVIRKEEDAKAIKPHVVVIGGGYIGIETASAFAGWGFDVTLVISHKLAMSKLFTIKMASWFERYFEENHSINIIKETRVLEFLGKGNVEQVVLSSGEVLNCDMVVCGIGGRPNIELVKGQLNLLSKKDVGGILTNAYLQTSHPDVYAMGDVAAFPRNGYLTRLEHVDNCRNSAALVAYNLMNPRKPRNYTYFPYFYSRMFEYTDNPVVFRFYGERGEDESYEIVQFGDFNSSRTSMFGAFWVSPNDIVTGGLLCNASSNELYDKLRDICLSRPTLSTRTEEAALSLFTQNMIVDLV
eukprot:maker-scaffold_5-snap-gene-5.58-mRNA-1 protein AED:0.06 eAED:0.06 QI:0/0/0/1/0/0/2/0/461